MVDNITDVYSDDQSEHLGRLPFLATVAGVRDERTYFSEAVGVKGRHSLVASGWHKLVVPGVLATLVSIAGFSVMGVWGPCFGHFFFMANAWIQHITNPLISERKALHLRTGGPAIVAFALLLVSGTFAATLLAWVLFKAEVDQRHLDGVAKEMISSQEKINLDYAERALERERANLSSKQTVSTTAVDQAMKTFVQAQDATLSANKAYQDEVSKGRGGRVAGDGPVAKALWQALQDAKTAEARAKQALDEARSQAAAQLSVPQELVDAYNVAKGAYEAREKSLIAGGPGLLKTFWWLAGMLHTHPLLIVFVVIWTTGEASSVISHALSGRNVYERVRFATIKEDMDVQREARRILQERVKERAQHRADMLTARKSANVLLLETKDRFKR